MSVSLQPTCIVVPPLAPEVREALKARFNQATDSETRLRYQMVWISSEQGLSTWQIAALVLRSHDVVLRVIKRFLANGLEAVPRRRPPGRPRRISAEWESELLRVVELDPHTVGVQSANWTTQLLADYLKAKTDIAVDQETTRRHLHRLGYVCKRPNWTVQHKANERPDYEGKGCGWKSS